MASSWLNWQNLNGQRSFPIEETANKMSDSGEKLPDELLTTAKLKFPDTLGKRAALTGIVFSENMVSASFVACDEDYLASSVEPLAVVTVLRSQLVEGKPYAVSALADGVGGWVAFGSGVMHSPSAVTSYKFSTPGQAPVIASQARSYPVFPVPCVKYEYSESELEGLITLRGIGGLIVERAERTLNGVLRTCVVFRIDTSNGYDILSDYAGPCSGLPESGTCDFTPIRQINTVPPDEDGNIDISFAGGLLTAIEVANGISLNFPISQVELCEAWNSGPAPDGTIPAGEDTCN